MFLSYLQKEGSKMVDYSGGLHHLHLRKRIHKHKEKYLHPNKFKRNYDKLMHLIAILVPIMALPQVFKIWYYKDASGISIFSFASFFVFAFMWLIYAGIHRARPLIIMYILLMLIHLSIVVGAIVY